jgi:hypothetical protein
MLSSVFHICDYSISRNVAKKEDLSGDDGLAADFTGTFKFSKSQNTQSCGGGFFVCVSRTISIALKESMRNI